MKLQSFRTDHLNHTSIFFIGFILSICFSILVCFVSTSLHPRFIHHKETVQAQIDILKGKYIVIDGEIRELPWHQNRILFPLMLKYISKLPALSVSQWYLFLRFCTAILAFFTFWFLLIKIGLAHVKIAAMGMGYLAYALIFSFNHGWEHTSDFFDIFFITLFLWTALRRYRLLLVLTTIFASLNRESAMFSGVLWFFLYCNRGKGLKSRLMETLFALFLTISSYCTIMILRYSLGKVTFAESQIFTLALLPSVIKAGLAHFSFSSWIALIVAMFLPLILWILGNYKSILSQHIHLLMAAIAITLISNVFGLANELRIFLPTMVILIFVAVNI
jgi:hypothetical protein